MPNPVHYTGDSKQRKQDRTSNSLYSLVDPTNQSTNGINITSVYHIQTTATPYHPAPPSPPPFPGVNQTSASPSISNGTEYRIVQREKLQRMNATRCAYGIPRPNKPNPPNALCIHLVCVWLVVPTL